MQARQGKHSKQQCKRRFYLHDARDAFHQNSVSYKPELVLRFQDVSETRFRARISGIRGKTGIRDYFLLHLLAAPRLLDLVDRQAASWLNPWRALPSQDGAQ